MKKPIPIFLLILLACVCLTSPQWRSRPAQASEPRGAAHDGLGYGAAFDAELKKIGQISPEEFARRYRIKGDYLPAFDWDPTSATFFDRFDLDPNAKDAKVRARGDEERMLRETARKLGKPIPEGEPVYVAAHARFDFRLTMAEMAKFKRNGFVVSERLGSQSFTESFYRLYKRDLPVFVSSDAVLHAWHRSYDALLEEIETSMLIPALNEILSAMAAKVEDARRDFDRSACRAGAADADFFLAVARSLLADAPVKTVLGDDERVTQTLAACRSLGFMDFDIFGATRKIDFSQFKPRGHYEKSEELKRYFKAMMWCGRIGLAIEREPRQLGSALVLHDLLKRSGKFERWQQFDAMIQTFVGRADSLTFAQFGDLLAAAGVRSPAELADEAALEKLQLKLRGGAGAPEIRDETGLSRSLTFLGQRFVVDSWATSKVVYDDIKWDKVSVRRRIPSCLDVSFAALANDNAVPLLVERINNRDGRKFRDGLSYQHNLAAVRDVLDAKPASLWRENLYTGWLGCLRELSPPTTDKKYPQAMRTREWGMKTLNTQHASWTQLRHDTILYVKQSYTAVPGCYYPAGYVEPLPAFWKAMEDMTARAAKLIEDTPYPQPAIRERQAKFLRTFSARMTTLAAIAEKELARRELTKEETKFLEDVIETSHGRFGSGSILVYHGWYPNLFYLGANDSLKWDALVADVHTNPPSPHDGDPGCVLHQGVGSVDLLLIAVDSGRDKMVYAGPVLSHYEFEMPGVSRKADSEWKKELREGRHPPRPEWTAGYLVPGHNPEVSRYAD